MTATLSPRSTRAFQSARACSPTSAEAEHHLELRADALLQRGEAELAGLADEDDPTGNADDVVGLLGGLEVAPPLADLLQGVGAGHVTG